MTWGKRRALVIVLVLLFVVLIGYGVSSSQRVPGNSVLVLDLSGTLEEQRPFDLLSALSGVRIPVLHDVVDELDTAKSDSRITGLVVRIGPLETGWGKLEEIHEHLLAFRQSHKPSICYLGYDGVGNREYYLASGCDQVWLVPSSQVGIRGMMAEALFLRGTLDKLKIVPDYYHIAEFKTASNQLTEKKFTPEHREEVESLVHDTYEQYVTETAQARGMHRATFEGLVREGPIFAQDALDKKLVDKLGYWDEVQAFFSKQSGEWTPVSLDHYRNRVSNQGAERIAVVYASGLIVSGSSGNSPSGGFVMGGDSVAADLREAREDDSIKAIVLRVDSGGGSALASEVIRREVELSRVVKPVVVSMSDVAASGGYWIAMSANKIVADPNTITASIGVLGGKMNVSGLYAMLGLSTDHVETSENATLYSDQQNFTPAQRAYFQKSLQDTYASFLRGVADGRKMKVEDVDKIAKGRVWSGTQAKRLGLVDELGGLDRALTIAKNLAHIPPSTTVRIVRLPGEKTLFEQIFEREPRMQESRIDSLQAMLSRLAAMDHAVQARVPFELHIQ
jgi:protease IV